MNKYIKDDKVINATEKAYNVIYKEKGYVPYKETEKEKSGAETDIKDISKMKKEDLLTYATENEIIIPEEITKVEDIRKFIKEVEEEKEKSGADE